MNLNQYPEAIAQAKLTLIRAEQIMRRLEGCLDRLTTKIDSSIAFDAELKNEAQRKARRAELMQSEEFQSAEESYNEARVKLAELEVDYRFLCDRFAVAKLQARESIARLELQSASAA